MLNVRMNNKEGCCDLLVSGDILEITADVSMLIKLIYERLDDERHKKFFADGITGFMREGVYKMSGEELDKHNQEREKEKSKKKDLAKLVEKLFGGFNEEE